MRPVAVFRRCATWHTPRRALINDHIDHCLVHAEEGEGTKAAVEQFRAISKYW